MTGFVKVGFHPLAGTRGGPPATPRERRPFQKRPTFVAPEPAKAPEAAPRPARPRRARPGK